MIDNNDDIEQIGDNDDPPGLNRSSDDLAVAVATAYDLQKLRIMTGNRLCASLRNKLGMKPSDAEEDQEAEVKSMLDQLRQDYDLMTEGVVAVTKPDGSLVAPLRTQFKPVGCITTYGEFMLTQQYLALEAMEKDHFKKTLPSLLKGIPIYDLFLAHVKGVGPAMASIIVRYFDIHAGPKPSSFWKFAGLDVVNVQDKDGQWSWEGRSRRKNHLVPRTYTDREGEEKQTVGVSFNPFVKTKLMGVLGPSFVKSNSPYAQVYRDYKNRLQSDARHSDKTPKHKHNMALRQMVKIFLADLHTAWREIEGLPYVPTYEEAKLGHVHGGGQQRTRLATVVWPAEKKSRKKAA